MPGVELVRLIERLAAVTHIRGEPEAPGFVVERQRDHGARGACEGAGYRARGRYRSSTDCIMFTRSQAFCAACRRAISQVIDFYSSHASQ